MCSSSEGAGKHFPTHFMGFQTPLTNPPQPIHPAAHSPKGPFAHPAARLGPRQGRVPCAREEAEAALAPWNGGTEMRYSYVYLITSCGCLPTTEENPEFCDGERGGWWLEALEEALRLGEVTELRQFWELENDSFADF